MRTVMAEPYAGARSFYRFEAAVREIYGFRHVMYFTTTRAHQEMQGGMFLDVIIDEALQVAARDRGRRAAQHSVCQCPLGTCRARTARDITKN